MTLNLKSREGLAAFRRMVKKADVVVENFRPDVKKRLKIDYKDEFGNVPRAVGYETLLYDAMIGDNTLFHRTDMVEAAWRVASPVLECWSKTKAGNFPNYAAGSQGPAAADEIAPRPSARVRSPPPPRRPKPPTARSSRSIASASASASCSP